jgi:hypothetical protein
MSFFTALRESAARKIVEKLTGCSLVEVELVAGPEPKTVRVLAFTPLNYKTFIAAAERLSLRIVLTREGVEPEVVWIGLK